MRFAVLGSGSGGNAAVVESGGTRVLIDAGLSAKQLLLRMRRIGIDPGALDGILLTHEHGDHVSGLRVLMKSLAVPVFATPSTSHVVRENLGPISWKLFESGSCFGIGDLEIESFAVPHDAVEPVGFVFRRDGRAIGLLSDAGHVTQRVRDLLSGVQALFIEANYDDELLEADTKRPWSTKQRIASRHGHLSNAQAAALIKELVPAGLKRVVLGHLSRDCNTPEVAIAAMRQLGVEVACACQHEPTDWHHAESEADRNAGIAFAKDELFG
ncbi:MBL fold metallo-hydrolase [Haloferula sp.]|uniref:MBL fold metallo-hydrolase n=1 Tax=Haloferula sp. TaxID=2497595 RepID=UPI003C74A91A